MRFPSKIESLEQWRLLYGEPEHQDAGADETADKLNQGVEQISEQPDSGTVPGKQNT